jgi:hypothetical protein
MNATSIGKAVGTVLATAIIVATLFLATPYFADPDAVSVIVKAPTKANVGKLILLDVSESNAVAFTWKVIPETDNFVVDDDGKRAFFSAEAAGEYTFVIAGAKDNEGDIAIHKITIGGGPAAPTDGLADKIKGWSDPVKSPTKRDDALKLSQSFASVSAIVQPTMKPADILEATKKSNRDALGDNMTLWTPFFESLQKELQARAAAGKLTDADSHAKAWREIADGLRKYAESM